MDWRVRIQELHIADLRCLRQGVLEHAGCINLLSGPNGSGKSSVLEAIYLLGRGQTFRHREARPLIREGARSAVVRAAMRMDDGRASRLAIQREGADFRARADAEDLHRRSDLLRRFPLVLMHPASHLLIEGGAGVRRRWLDLGVFHVEQGYQASIGRYMQALRQRNAALRAASRSMAAAYEPVLAEVGWEISQMRLAYLEGLLPILHGLLAEMSWAQELQLQFEPGMRSPEALLEGFAQDWARDRKLGYTGAGSHRADMQFSVAGVAAPRRLSRGQQKYLVFALTLAQALYQVRRGCESPVLLMDDLDAELDDGAIAVAAERIQQSGLQGWIASSQGRLARLGVADAVFHVEQGEVRRAQHE